MAKSEEIRRQIAELEAQLREAEAVEVEEDLTEEPVVVPAENDVVDAEFEINEDDPATEGDEEKPELLVHVGFTNKGRPIFQIEGDTNLFTLDGIVRYLERQLDKEWAIRDRIAEQARLDAQAKAEATE